MKIKLRVDGSFRKEKSNFTTFSTLIMWLYAYVKGIYIRIFLCKNEVNRFSYMSEKSMNGDGMSLEGER